MKNCILLLSSLGVFLSGCGGDAPTEPIVNSPTAAQPATIADDDALPMVPPEPAPARDPLGLIIAVEELQERIESIPPRIIDVRQGGQYSTAHIPGAVVVNLQDWKDSSLSPDGLENPDDWSERIGNLGIDASTQVVVYGESPANAARAWWILKYLGVREVAMLDGGWAAWQASGAATDDESPDIEPVEFTPAFQTQRLVRIQELAAEPGIATVIDTRSDAEFDGTGGPGERRGHIPGAVHLEWSEFMAEDGRFRPVDEIQSLLGERGISSDDPNVVHCQTGGRASVAALALELAGFGPAQNYYCGWAEWSAAEDTPIEAAPVEP